MQTSEATDRDRGIDLRLKVLQSRKLFFYFETNKRYKHRFQFD